MQSYIPSGYILRTPNRLEKTPNEWVGISQRFDDNLFYFKEYPSDDALKVAPQGFKFDSYQNWLGPKLPYVPELEFNNIYSYLGDFEVHSDCHLDLRLKNHSKDTDYELVGKLPEGLNFINGILSGKVTQTSELIRIKIKAQDNLKVHEREFYLRFYENKVARPSFVKDNYIQLGFGKNMVEYDRTQPFIRYISPDLLKKKTTDLPFQYAVQLAHHLIDQAEEKGKEPILFASGGIDSQCMIQAFVASQRKFRVVFMKDTNGMNQEDFHFFQDYSKRFNFTYELYDMDYIDFIANYRYLPMALKYRFNNPEYGLLLQLMEQFDGFYVYAGRPCSVNQSMNGYRVLGLAVDETWSKARYLERNDRQGCPEFLSGSLELLLSFLNRPILSQLDEKNERWYYRHKLELLRQSGFDITCAPPTKLTGFERGKELMELKGAGDIWIEHRQPLKLFFANPCCRATNRLDDSEGLGFKMYPDGFSWDYFQKEDIGQFH